jgi:hypothetical protein
MTSHEGGCLCGEVRFRVSVPPLDSGYCHCRMCQKNSGAPVVAWVLFPSAGFSWTAGSPASYQSSARATRQFCTRCGSYMVFRSDDFPTEVSVNTASLDNPGAYAPSMHIFVESRIAWFHVDDDLPKHSGYGPFSRGDDS